VVTERAKRRLIGVPVESQVNPEPIALGEIDRGMRIRSRDYGTGTVVAIVATGVQVWWDEPLVGTAEHQMIHDKAYILSLQRL
jgi:hypothetical protein